MENRSGLLQIAMGACRRGLRREVEDAVPIMAPSPATKLTLECREAVCSFRLDCPFFFVTTDAWYGQLGVHFAGVSSDSILTRSGYLRAIHA